MALPQVATREQWLAARRELLAREKENTKARDALNADRRRLPMVQVEKEYEFEGPQGQVTLGDLFDGRRQLIVKHVMFGPDWAEPCPGCSGDINETAPGLLDTLHARETTYVLTSRAPYSRLAEVKAERGWFMPWFSAFGSDFNFDFQVSLDQSVPQVEYNYRPELQLLEDQSRSSEQPGYSCFLREGDAIFHTYSTYARGTEYIGNGYTLLDLTALGRQEDWEEPKGRSEKPLEWSPETYWTK